MIQQAQVAASSEAVSGDVVMQTSKQESLDNGGDVSTQPYSNKRKAASTSDVDSNKKAKFGKYA